MTTMCSLYKQRLSSELNSTLILSTSPPCWLLYAVHVPIFNLDDTKYYLKASFVEKCNEASYLLFLRHLNTTHGDLNFLDEINLIWKLDSHVSVLILHQAACMTQCLCNSRKNNMHSILSETERKTDTALRFFIPFVSVLIWQSWR